MVEITKKFPQPSGHGNFLLYPKIALEDEVFGLFS
jgi:hypothetical protein